MSGTANPLQAPVGAPQQAMPAAAPVAPPPPPVNQALASSVMRGRTAQHMVRRRDAAGGEMEILAKLMNEPNPTSREVESYIHKLLQKEHITGDEASRILASIPRDPTALRAWARNMFAAVMHEGIHAHAAFPRSLYPGETPTDGPGTEAGA